MSHTPGPWVAHVGGMDALVRCPDGRTFLVGDAIYHRDNVANAHLIAASPDLLAALKALFADYKRLADSGDAGNWKLEELAVGTQALVAIAKAEGL